MLYPTLSVRQTSSTLPLPESASLRWVTTSSLGHNSVFLCHNRNGA